MVRIEAVKHISYKGVQEDRKVTIDISDGVDYAYFRALFEILLEQFDELTFGRRD